MIKRLSSFSGFAGSSLELGIAGLATVALSCSPGMITTHAGSDGSVGDGPAGAIDGSATVDGGVTADGGLVADSAALADGALAGDGAAAVDSGSTAADAAAPPSLPLCVWNQAYQENYSADSVADIVANAESCYVLIDPFESTAARNAIAQMHLSNNIVGCYISSGTCEDWRDDFAAMQPHCVDQQWGEWAGEYFVDMPSPALIAIMHARIDNMAAWGCDMVEFDNMDWAFDDDYREEYGFAASATDGIAYNQALCDYTQSKGLGCMAKNTREGAAGFDGGTFESYNDDLNWWETAHLHGFLNDAKLGIIVHYDDNDCDGTYADYQGTYGSDLSFICEDRGSQEYAHYN